MSGLPLAVSGLHLAFDGTTAVDLPSMSATPGTMTVLSGPSGSGKSTMLYLLSGLLAPDTGSIRWDGANIARMAEARRDRWRREYAGFIFQDFQLIDELSPLDNVLVPAWLSAYSAGPMRETARASLARLGVPLERSRTSLLSRGEQQRVAIARALVTDPAIVFADEPTASLDTAAAALVVDALVTMAHREGRTVIVASHDPALLAVADSIVRLDHGHAREVAA